ncbi:MAG: glucose-6-phosphate isomerase, partial [Chloroflexota bacterium]
MQIPEIESALAGLESRDVVARIWRKDHTVWRADPTEIANRLGWLNTTEQMCELVPALETFAAEVRSAGFRHVVLLGMGGSSQGPDVLRQVLGPINHPSGSPSPRIQEAARQPELHNYPTLIVLDSTVPASVRAVSGQIDPARTLFLVSSKSGGTTETNSFYRHFRGLLERAVGTERAGRSFVAITDQGTTLEKLAQDEGFRRIFLNSPEIGGRFSVLSYFGLVPAVLAGIDVGILLDRANCMREACAPCVPARENPGALLGATIGVLARQGRDKLTLVTPPPLESFGLWVEQLLAESLGKDGKGIIPVAGEPWLEPGSYGRDRLFVYLTLAGADNPSPTGRTNTQMLDRIGASGHPVLRLELKDRYDLGAEFFRWELATAVAGSLLDVHPFDQPDVQGSKDNTDRVLEGFRRDGRLPPMAESGKLSELLRQAEPGDYLAIMAYIQPDSEVEGLFAELRRRVGGRLGIATTVGYGPRYLHSTGPLHKGGPATGLYLQLTADYTSDAPIPGQEYDFGVLATAQAIGDFGAL